MLCIAEYENNLIMSLCMLVFKLECISYNNMTVLIHLWTGNTKKKVFNACCHVKCFTAGSHAGRVEYVCIQ